MKLAIDVLYIGMAVTWLILGWRLCRELRQERDQ